MVYNTTHTRIHLHIKGHQILN